MIEKLRTKTAMPAHTQRDFFTVAAPPVAGPEQGLNGRRAGYQFVNYQVALESTSPNFTSKVPIQRRYRGRIVNERGCQTDRYLLQSLVAEHVIYDTLDAISHEGNPDVFHALLALVQSYAQPPKSFIHELVADDQAGNRASSGSAPATVNGMYHVANISKRVKRANATRHTSCALAGTGLHRLASVVEQGSNKFRSMHTWKTLPVPQASSTTSGSTLEEIMAQHSADLLHILQKPWVCQVRRSQLFELSMSHLEANQGEAFTLTK